MVVVSYSGDSLYASATSSVTLNVTNDNLSVSYATQVLSGTSYTVSAAITGALVNSTPRTGTLSLMEGANTLASVNVATATANTSGYYALTVPGGLSTGTHNLKVVYSGDSNYSAATFTMAPVVAANDTLALSYSSTALVGQPYSMSVAINGALINNTARTGTLSLIQGTTTLASVDVAATTPNSSGYYTLTVPGGFPLGVNSLKVAYSGDSNYSSNSTYLIVTGFATLPTSLGISSFTPLAGQAWSVSAVINGTLLAGTPRTGTLTATLGGTTLASINLATSTPNSNGFYSLSVPNGLPLGSDTVVVTYSGDSNYGSSTSSTNLNVLNDSLSLSYSNSQVLSGQPYTVNAAINGSLINNTPRTGTLSLMQGSTPLASVNVATATPSSSGYYALTVPGGLAVGVDNLTVVYSGDSNYSALTVNLAPITVANDALAVSYASNALVGQSYSLSAAINGALINSTPRTGTLSLVQGTTTLASVNVATTTPSSSGYYTLTVPAGVPLGINSFKVVYSGDSNYSSNYSYVTVTGVNLLPTYITPSWSTPLANQPWTLSAAVNGTLLTGISRTGTLTATLNGNTLASVNLATATPNSSGYYTLSVPGGLPLGSDAVVVSYSGDATYASSTTTLTLNVLNDSLALSYSSSQVLSGTAYTVSAAINGALVNSTPRTGTLSLMEGSNTLATVNVATTTPNSSGYYSLTVPSGLANGLHNLTVVYSGDSNYSALTQNLAPITVTNDTLTLNYNSTALLGQAYSMTVAINGSLINNTPRTGTLSIVLGTSTLASIDISVTNPNSSGYYTLTIPGGVPLGNNFLKLVYSGDSTYTSNSSSFVVTGANLLPTGIGMSWTNALAGQAWTLYASLNGTLLTGTPRTGTLTATLGGNTLASVNVATSTPNSSGYYTLSVPGGLPLGTDAVVVTYSGDSTYASSTATVTLNILNDSLSLSYNSSQVLSGTAYTVNAAINGSLINNTPRTGTLSLMEGTNTLASVNVATTTPNSSGQYALTVPGGLATGVHNLTVVYTGDSNYSALTQNLVPLTVSNDSLTLNYNGTALVGQAYSMTVAINGSLINNTPRTGTLSIVQGTTTLASIDISVTSPNSSGYYTVSIPGGVALGTNSLKLVYSGDSTYSSNSSLFTVTGANLLPTSLAPSYGIPLAGQAWTLNVAVNGTLLTGTARTGTITATLGGNTLASVNLATATPNSNGYYTLSVPGGLPVGTDAVVVSYSGDATYASSTTTLTLSIVNDGLAISYSSSQVLSGQSYTVSAAITGGLINSAPTPAHSHWWKDPRRWPVSTWPQPLLTRAATMP